MSGSTRKPVFLEPAELPNECTEVALQRLAVVLKTLGIEVVEDRPNVFSEVSGATEERDDE